MIVYNCLHCLQIVFDLSNWLSMVWAFSAENVSNVKNYFINFCNAVFAYILNNTVIFPTFLGGFRGPYIYIYI